MKYRQPEVYRTGHWLCFDLETTNLSFGSALIPGNRVVMIAWQEKGGSVQHHYGNPLEARGFWEALERADFVIAQASKFEAHWLKRLGYDPAGLLWYDTLLAERVRMGNRRKPLDLGAISKRYGFQGKEGLIDSLMKTGVCPSEMPERGLIARCRRDVKTTAAVAMKQIEVLARLNSLRVVLTRCQLMPILVHIEANGIVLDKARVTETYNAYLQQAVDLAAKFKAFTGGINLRSSDQMAVFLYQTLKFPERTNKRRKPLRNKPDKPKKDGSPQKWPEGKPRTDNLTLEWLGTKAKTKRQKNFVALREEYGSVMAALSKNLEFFYGVTEELPGCRFHGQFNQAIAGTHRLTASGLPLQFRRYKKLKSVQFQNMPRIFKRLFTVSDPDYLMVEADGSQLEFRVAAYLGQDKQAMHDIADPDFDIHIQTAATMHERDYNELLAAFRAGDKAVAELRTDAKPDTFKPLYGGSQGTPEQERYYRAFRDIYRDLFHTQEGWVSQVLGSGKLVTPWGLRFYWDYYIDDTGTAKGKDNHKPISQAIFNYPVQSLATAEIIPIALIALFRRCRARSLRVRFVNTVHDSVVAEVHKADLEQYKQVVVKAFTTDVYMYLQDVYGMAFNVPLGCEIKWGTHWSEEKSMKQDVKPEERAQA